MNRRQFNCLLTHGLLASVAVPRWAAAIESPALRTSCMLWTLTKQAPFERCLEIVAKAGLQGVELVGEFHSWAPADYQRILRRVRSLGLVVDAMSGVQAGFAVPSETDAFMQQMEAHIRSAQMLDCRRVILLSGPRVPALTEETQRQTAINNLSRAAELTARAQIEIVIEPIDPLENPSIFLQTVTEGFRLAQAVNQPNLKVLYDLYHEQRAFGNLIEKLEQNIDKVGLVHVADVPGRHEPGTGEIDYPVIYRKLAELNYRGWIAMEFYPTADPAEALRTARETAEREFRTGGSGRR